METGNKIDEAILLEYLSGKIFGKEKVDVETWIAQSETNEQLTRDIHYIYYSKDNRKCRTTHFSGHGGNNHSSRREHGLAQC